MRKIQKPISGYHCGSLLLTTHNLQNLLWRLEQPGDPVVAVGAWIMSHGTMTTGEKRNVVSNLKIVSDIGPNGYETWIRTDTENLHEDYV